MYSSDSYAPDNQDFGSPAFEDPWSLQDADFDGISNQTEIILGTDPYRADTDGDGLSDSQELTMGTNPLYPDLEWDRAYDGRGFSNAPQPNQVFPPTYERLSQGIDPTLTPFLHAQKVAQTALEADYSSSSVHELLRESHQFKQIESRLGQEQAEQFTALAIAAAERQNALNSLPPQPIQPDIRPHKQKQPRIN